MSSEQEIHLRSWQEHMAELDEIKGRELDIEIERRMIAIERINLDAQWEMLKKSKQNATESRRKMTPKIGGLVVRIHHGRMTAMNGEALNDQFKFDACVDHLKNAILAELSRLVDDHLPFVVPGYNRPEHIYELPADRLYPKFYALVQHVTNEDYDPDIQKKRHQTSDQTWQVRR